MLVGVFGGSFDPPHVGHVLAVTYALVTGGFERVLVVPVFSHPFEKQLVSFDDRVEMCRMAMGWIPGIEVSRIEESLEAPSLTLRTVQRLAEEHPGWKLRLIVGADVLGEASGWHAFDEVKRLAPLFVLARHGAGRSDAPRAVLPDVSSSAVRGLLARRGAPETDVELARVVPRSVLAYADAHGLYR